MIQTGQDIPTQHTKISRIMLSDLERKLKYADD